MHSGRGVSRSWYENKDRMMFWKNKNRNNKKTFLLFSKPLIAMKALTTKAKMDIIMQKIKGIMIQNTFVRR